MIYDEMAVVGQVRRIGLDELHVFVRQGWVRPARGEDGPLYDDLDVARIRLICDLSQDMDLSEDTLPVVLSLLDQLHGVRRELHELASAVESQPEPVRRAVIAAVRARGELREPE